MTDKDIRHQQGEKYNKDSNNMKQHIGPANLHFTLRLVDDESSFQLITTDDYSPLVTVLYSHIRCPAMAHGLFRRLAEQLIATGHYRLQGSLDGPRRGRSMSFAFSNLLIWRTPNV